jgi:hypothetical protein
MNKPSLLLNLLLFASLTSFYNLTILGMEREYKIIIEGTCYTTDCRDAYALFRQHYNLLSLCQLPKEIVTNHINPALKNWSLTLKEKNDLRLVSKKHAQECAKNPAIWTPMPDNVEKVFDRFIASTSDKKILLPYSCLSKNYSNSLNRSYASGLILSFLVERNDDESALWIINNIKPVPHFLQEMDPTFFTIQYNNKILGEVLYKMLLKNVGTSEEMITDIWESEYNRRLLPEYIKSLLPSNQQNSFFPSYSLAAKLDDINRLKELCSQTKPTNIGATDLLFLCNDNSPNCFIYLFEEYKKYFKTQAELIDRCCLYTRSKDIKKYLNEQKLVLYNNVSSI